MRLFALLSLCLAAASPPALPAPTVPEARAEALALAMADFKTPAMAVIEIRGGQAQPEAVRGVRRGDRPDPVRPGDRVALLPESGNGVLVAANAADSMGDDKATVTAARALAGDLAPPKPADPAAAPPAS